MHRLLLCCVIGLGLSAGQAGAAAEPQQPKVAPAPPRQEGDGPYSQLILRNATVINGSGVGPYVADIGITGNRRVRSTGGKREVQVAMNISDMGDLRKSGAIRVIEASGMTAVPDTGYQEGALVDLPDWKTKTDVTIGTGQPPRIALLRPAEGGKYRVEVVIR